MPEKKATGGKTLFDKSMELKPTDRPNVRQAVPFFAVGDIEASIRFYVDGLGFTMTRNWKPEGRIRWCWLELDEVAVMLQEYAEGEGAELGKPGLGVSIEFVCADALKIYHDAIDRGLAPSRPFVGNNMWVTSLTDPDGYRLEFESPTDVPEETLYSTDA